MFLTWQGLPIVSVGSPRNAVSHSLSDIRQPIHWQDCSEKQPQKGKA